MVVVVIQYVAILYKCFGSIHRRLINERLMVAETVHFRHSAPNRYLSAACIIFPSCAIVGNVHNTKYTKTKYRKKERRSISHVLEPHELFTL